MSGLNPECPIEISNVQDVLGLLGVEWKTEEYLTRLHLLAEKSLFAARQIIKTLIVCDSTGAKSSLELWVEHLLLTAVEIRLYPDPAPDDGADWEALSKTWDEYTTHASMLHLTGSRSFSEGDRWSIRGATLAAWDIELASVGSISAIGPIVADSAHRAALRLAPELWIAYKYFVEQALENPKDQPRLWDRFFAQWCSETILSQCQIVRATLASELSKIRHQLNPPCETYGNEEVPLDTEPVAVIDDEIDHEKTPALSNSEKLVLCALAVFDVHELVSASDIVESMDPMQRLSQRTVTPAIRKLVEADLAERPEGERQGARLILRGRRLASKIAD